MSRVTMRLSGPSPHLLIMWLQNRGLLTANERQVSHFISFADAIAYEGKPVVLPEDIEELEDASISDGTYVADIFLVAEEGEYVYGEAFDSY